MSVTGVRVSGYLDTGLVEIYVLDCARCGVVFGINTDYEQRRRDDGKGFLCPNGHSNSWHDTEADKLKRQLAARERGLANLHESLRSVRAESELQRRSAAAYKGHLTRMRRRIANGVCPCCSRSFQNVKRHMATQHPEVLEQLEAGS